MQHCLLLPTNCITLLVLLLVALVYKYEVCYRPSVK